MGTEFDITPGKKAERKSTKEKKEDFKKSNENYFEGVLQLRGWPEDKFNQIFEFIMESSCRITKHETHGEDIDLYLTSQKFLQQLAKWMTQRFNCQLSYSNTLHTRDTRANKDLYRVTVCARLLKHNAGSIIDYKGEKVKITSLGAKPSGIIITTGKRIFLDPKILQE